MVSHNKLVSIHEVHKIYLDKHCITLVLSVHSTLILFNLGVFISYVHSIHESLNNLGLHRYTF